MNLKSSLSALTASAVLGLVPLGANAALEPFKSFNGNVAMSTDGFGSLSNSGVIQASVPSGSTVVAAYLYSATQNSFSTPNVTLDGSAVSFGPRVGNGTACCSLASFRADVTGIVKTKIEGGGGGVYSFNIDEGLGNSSVDGEALVVVYSHPSLPEATVGILDGWASVTGDTTSINFADPLNPSDPGFFAEMILGINFSCCNQKSTVMVNGTTLTENAGNNDDGAEVANGSLITVGSFDDPLSPMNPSYENDHERYDLSPFVSAGDTTIKVDTVNASQDDNIFLAGFYVSGKAGINEPPPSDDDNEPPPPPPPTSNVPEPASLLLMGMGMLGLGMRRKKAA